VLQNSQERKLSLKCSSKVVNGEQEASIARSVQVAFKFASDRVFCSAAVHDLGGKKLTDGFDQAVPHSAQRLDTCSCIPAVPQGVCLSVGQNTVGKDRLDEESCEGMVSTVNPGARAGTEYSKVSPLRLK
jgi:hypothetical protein